MAQAILTRCNYYWRLFFTGVSFLLFAVGGLLLSLLAFPWVLLIPNHRWRQIIARKIVQYTFKFFIQFMRFFGLLSYEVSGFEKINQRKGLLIIANHPSLIDVVFLVSLIDNADCIVKSSLFNNPIMFGSTRSAHYIPNNANDAESLIKTCIERIHQGSNLIVFPEGTRTVTGMPIVFKRGTANIALKSNTNPTPIFISCTPPTLTKKDKWYNIPPKKMHITLHVQDDFIISPYQTGTNTISARLLTEKLSQYFNESQHNAQS